MPRLDEVAVTLACGATATLRVRVEHRGVYCEHEDCPDAVAVAGLIWLALREAETRADAPTQE